MKTDFSRTIVSTTIRVASVKVVDGTVETTELNPIIHVGTSVVKADKAKKIAKASYPDEQNLVILAVDAQDEVRGMDIATFMKYSTPVERPASQKKKN